MAAPSWVCQVLGRLSSAWTPHPMAPQPRPRLGTGQSHPPRVRDDHFVSRSLDQATHPGRVRPHFQDHTPACTFLSPEW